MGKIKCAKCWRKIKNLEGSGWYQFEDGFYCPSCYEREEKKEGYRE